IFHHPPVNSRDRPATAPPYRRSERRRGGNRAGSSRRKIARLYCFGTSAWDYSRETSVSTRVMIPHGQERAIENRSGMALRSFVYISEGGSCDGVPGGGGTQISPIRKAGGGVGSIHSMTVRNGSMSRSRRLPTSELRAPASKARPPPSTMKKTPT